MLHCLFKANAPGAILRFLVDLVTEMHILLCTRGDLAAEDWVSARTDGTVR